MDRVVPGEYATILKSGKFDGHNVKTGDRARVIRLEKHYSRKNKKVWAIVDLIGKRGGVTFRIKLPSWWLRPRSVLDDLAQI